MKSQWQNNSSDQYKELMAEALRAAENSYSPYSGYRVGAAILAADGRIFSGCNVENADIGGTICAERTAAVKAVSAGCLEFIACAVACPTDVSCCPCGICRQFLNEFNSDLTIITREGPTGLRTIVLSALLPQNMLV
ncbi:MAG: cytidine deaminase [Cyanobacteria bacterium REEB67]|nr:cytidine deaminase [Cyanobacteria bacterium REEB67]